MLLQDPTGNGAVIGPNKKVCVFPVSYSTYIRVCKSFLDFFNFTMTVMFIKLDCSVGYHINR